MKIAFKNFLQTLRRYKTASLLNIAGLTLAFTAFYVILVQVWWELGYNRSLPDSEQIYLVETEDWMENGNWSMFLSRPAAERTIASTPGVAAGGCVWGLAGEGFCWTRNEASYGYNKFTVKFGTVSLPLLDVFAFRSVAGDVHDLARPKTTIVSQETAERLNIGVGDMLWVDTDEPQPGEELEVVAVFEDFPDNSLLSDCKVLKNLGEQFIDQPYNWNVNYFIKLHPGADPEDFLSRWTVVDREMQREERERLAAAGEEPGDEEDEDGTHIRLRPIENLYFEATDDTPYVHGSIATTYTLLGIAVLVIVLAFINFVNFFFALIPVRIRTVNTFKVFGAPTSSLRFGFVFEAFGLAFLSLLASWYLIFALQGTEFASYVSTPLSLLQNLPVVGLVLAVAVAMPLAASLYPAYYITSFAPAMVVKGSFSGTRGGRRLRVILLGIQFFISIGLIIATCFLHLQHRYMMHYDMGFDKRNLLAVVCSEKVARNHEVLRGKLLSDPRVKDVTGAAGRLVAANRMGWGRQFKGRQIAFQTYPVQPNFLRVMGISIAEGRDFLESDLQKKEGTLIFNQAARREYGMEAGDRILGFMDGEEIIGFCTDFNFKPLQYAIEPLAFYVLPANEQTREWYLPHYVYVRTMPEADPEQVAEYLRRCITELDPRTTAGEIRVKVFEEELGEEYARERRLMVIVGAFSLLSVVIALMGVFGIVLFETQHRRREIAVRRVMGASQGEILGMFNRRYVTLVCICFLLAAPVSGWAVHRWLTGFAYATPMSWWVFAAAFAAVLSVTVLTVTVRSWRAANENPAESIKSE